MKKLLSLLLLAILLSGCSRSNLIVKYQDDLKIEQDGIIYLVDSFYEGGSNLTFRLALENITDEDILVPLESLTIIRLSNGVGYPVNCRLFDDNTNVAANSKVNLSCVVVLPTSIEDEHYKFIFDRFVFNLFEKE